MCWIRALAIQFVLASTLFFCLQSVNKACVWCNSSAERNFVSCLTQFISERPEFPDYAKKNLDIVMQETINAMENTKNTDEQAVSKIEALNTAMFSTSFKVLLESDEFQEKRNKASILIRGIHQCLVQTSPQDSDLIKNMQNAVKTFVAAGNDTNAQINQIELILEPNFVQQVNDGKHVVGQGANQADLSDSLNKNFEVYPHLLKPIKEKLKKKYSPSRDATNSLSKLLTDKFAEAKQYPEIPLSPMFTTIPATDSETQLLQVKNESMAFYGDYENGRNEEGQNISRFMNLEQKSSIYQNNNNFVDDDKQSPLKLLDNMSLWKLNPDNKQFEQTNRISRKLLSLETEKDEKRTPENVWQINPNFQEQGKNLWPIIYENTVPEYYGLQQTNKWSDMQDIGTFSRSASRNIEQKDLFRGQGSEPKIVAEFTETETQPALQTRYNDFIRSVASSEVYNNGMQSTRPEIQESRAQAGALKTEDAKARTFLPQENKPEFNGFGIQHSLIQTLMPQDNTGHPTEFRMQQPTVQIVTDQENMEQPNNQYGMQDLTKQTLPSRGNEIQPIELGVQRLISQPFQTQSHIAPPNDIEIKIPSIQTPQLQRNTVQPIYPAMRDLSTQTFPSQRNVAQKFPPIISGIQNSMQKNILPQENAAQFNAFRTQNPSVKTTLLPQGNFAPFTELERQNLMTQSFLRQRGTAQSTEHEIQDHMEENLKSQRNEAQRNEFKIHNSVPPTFPLKESIAQPTEFEIQYPVADAFQRQDNMILPTKLEIQNPGTQTYQRHGNIAQPTKQEIQGSMTHGFIPQENLVQYTKFKIQDPMANTAQAEGNLIQPTKSEIQHLKAQLVPPQDYPAQFTEFRIHDSMMQTQPQRNLAQLSEHKIRDPIVQTFQPQINTAQSPQAETYTQISEPFLAQVQQSEAQASVAEILTKAIKNILSDAQNHQTRPPLQEIQGAVTQSSTKEPGNVAQTIIGSEVQTKMTQYPIAKPQEMITNLPWQEMLKNIAQTSWPKIQENNTQHFESDEQKNVVYSTVPEMQENGVLTPSPDEGFNKFDNETRPSEQKINPESFRDGTTDGGSIETGNQEGKYQNFPETEVKALPLKFQPPHNETIGLESTKQTFSKEQNSDEKTKVLPKAEQASFLSERKLLAIKCAQIIYNNLISSEIFRNIFNDNMTESYKATLTYTLVKQSMSEYNTTISTNAATRVRKSVLSIPRYKSANDLARIFAGEISKTLYKWKLINAEPKQQASKISEKILQSLISLQQTSSTNTPDLTKNSSEYEKSNASESLSLYTPTKLMPSINKNEISHDNTKVLSRPQNQFMGNSYYGKNCNKSLSALNTTNKFPKTNQQKSLNVNPVSTSNSFRHFNKSEPFQNNSLIISKKECLLKSQLLWITNNPMYKFFNTFSNISMRAILDNMNFTETGMENSIKNFSCIVEKQITKSPNNSIKEKLTKMYYDMLKIVMQMVWSN